MRYRYLAAAGLLALVAACSGPAGHAASHAAAVGPGKSNAAKHAVPAQMAMRGTLSAAAAGTVYDAAIVPAYPLALKVADTLTHHPSAAAPAVSDFTSRLSKALASFSAVTAFPPRAEPSFAAYRARARSMLASLAQPASVTASEPARKQAALELYAFAQQIGVLGSDLNLVPATESGGKH